MKKQKLLSLLLALILSFSLTLPAFAGDSTAFQESISFLNEHKDMLDFYHSMRFERMTEKLNSDDISDEEKQQLTEDIDALKEAIENCLAGKHSYLIAMDDTVGPMDCTTTGICEYCGHSEIILTGNGYRERHRDSDKNGICDDCKREMPHLNCSHFCHSENPIVQKLLLPIFRIMWLFFNREEYCKCGTYHFN